MDLLVEAPVERIYRACKRDGQARVVYLKPDGKFGSAPARGPSYERLLRLEFGRIVGVYDHRLEPDWLLEDTVYVARKYGASV